MRPPGPRRRRAGALLLLGTLATGGPGRSPAAASTPTFVRTWHWSVLGNAVGRPGFALVDLDEDGVDEVIATASSADFAPASYWYVLASASTGYEQIASSPEIEGGLAGLAVAEVDGEPGPEVVLLLGNGGLEVHDARSRELERAFGTPSAAPLALALGDVDGDGTCDAVVTDVDATFVMDLAEGTAAVAAGRGGTGVAVGSWDDDAALEIAIAAGASEGVVLDGATLEPDWSREAGFGIGVRFAQLDGDAEQELLAGSGGLLAFDGPAGTELWQEEISDLESFAAADLDGVTGDEVVYGRGQWGPVRVLDGEDGAELWSVDNPENGVTAVGVGQYDADPQAELFWASGGVENGRDVLLVADGMSHEPEWESRDLRGPFRALAAGRIDGARPWLLAGSHRSDGGYEGEIVEADVHAGKLGRTGAGTLYEYGGGLRRLVTAPLDDDPPDEYCLADSPGFEGRVACFDGSTRIEQWSFALPEGRTARSLAVADVDADGQLELLFGTAPDWGASGLYVYCLDASTGWLEWRSSDLDPEGGTLDYLRAGPIDDDAALEIVVADPLRGVHLVDGATGARDGGPWTHEVTALEVAALEGSPKAEIYLGLATGEIHRLDPDAGTTDLARTVEDAPGSLRVADLDRDGEPEFVYAAAGVVRARRMGDGEAVFESGWLGLAAGAEDALLIADVDGDFLDDLTVGTTIGFSVFASGAGEQRIFAGDFESGGLEGWTSVPAFGPGAPGARSRERDGDRP